MSGADDWLPALLSGVLAGLGRASLQGGAALLAVWLIMRGLRRLRPQTACWLWRVAYLKALLSLLVPGALVLPLLPAERPSPVLATTAVAHDASPAEGVRSRAMPIPPTPGSTPSQSAREGAPRAVGGVDPPDAPSGTQPLLSVLVAAWALGVAAGLGRLWREQRWVRGLRQRAILCEEGAARQEMVLACRGARLGRAPRLLASDEVHSPMLTGILRPAVLLPTSMAEAERSPERPMLLAHEVAHLRRRDLLWSWVPALCELLLFFHPCHWLARGEWRLAEDLSCDAAALSLQGADPARYATALVSAAQGGKLSLGTWASAATRGSYTTLLRRIQAMGDTYGPTRRASAWSTFSIALVALVALPPWALVARALDNAAPPGSRPPHVLAPARTATDPARPGPGAATVSGRMIEGVVLGPAGERIRGARVTQLGSLRPGSLSRARLASSTTDSLGRFRLRVIPGSELLAEAAGYGVDSASVAPARTKTLITLRPATEVRALVLEPNGSPAAGVAFRILDIYEMAHPVAGAPFRPHSVMLPSVPRALDTYRAVTSPQGILRIPGLLRARPGWDCQIRMVTSDPRYTDLGGVLGTTRGLKLSGGPVSDLGTLKLRLAGSISGRVFFGDTGRPAKGVRVTGSATSGWNTPRGAEQPSWCEAITDADGRYVLPRLAEGPYRVGPDTQGTPLGVDWCSVYAPRVQVTGGQRSNGVDFQLEHGGLVTGTVMGSDGTPLKRVMMGAHPSRERLPESGEDNLYTDTDDRGRYRFRLPAGTAGIFVNSAPKGFSKGSGGQGVSLTLRDGDSVTRDFVLKPAAGGLQGRPPLAPPFLIPRWPVP